MPDLLDANGWTFDRSRIVVRAHDAQGRPCSRADFFRDGPDPCGSLVALWHRPAFLPADSGAVAALTFLDAPDLVPGPLFPSLHWRGMRVLRADGSCLRGAHPEEDWSIVLDLAESAGFLRPAS